MRQAIETKYVGPTNSRGSRVSARAYAGRVMVHWDDALDVDQNHMRAAHALAKKFGWKGRLYGGARPDGKGNVYVFDDPADRSSSPRRVLRTRRRRMTRTRRRR